MTNTYFIHADLTKKKYFHEYELFVARWKTTKRFKKRFKKM